MPEAPGIVDVITAAGERGNAHCKAVIGQTSPWLSEQAKALGLDIEGFRHSFDTSAARHIKGRYTNAKIEKIRGQLALTDFDIARIPEILQAPDRLIFGAENPRHQPVIGYIKRLADGTTLLLQEVRTGKKELAVLSMRKYPATALSDSISATLEPNGRTDGEARIHIVDVPENVTAIVPLSSVRQEDKPQAKRRFPQYLPPVLGVAVLAAVLFGLHSALKKISPGDVMAALTATSRAQLEHALGLLAFSCCVMAVYDIPGILFAKKLMRFPRIGFHRIGLASFSAYALSHVLGAPAISGAAIRVRLYAQWGVPAAGVARIVALSGTMFILGAFTLLGAALLLHPLDLPLFGHDVSLTALRAVGAALWAVVAGYVVAAHGQKPLTIFSLNIPRPGSKLAVAQVLLACMDIGVACGIFYVVLPAAPGLSYPHVLAIYLAAFAGGLVSGLPGGVGVFDSLLLLGLAGTMDTASAIGAILLFRVLYYLIPAALAALSFGVHEIWITAKGRQA